MGTQMCRRDNVIPVTLLEWIFLLKFKMTIWTLLSRVKGESFVMGFKEAHSEKCIVTDGSPNLQRSLQLYAVFTTVSHTGPKILWGPPRRHLRRKEPLDLQEEPFGDSVFERDHTSEWTASLCASSNWGCGLSRTGNRFCGFCKWGQSLGDTAAFSWVWGE